MKRRPLGPRTCPVHVSRRRVPPEAQATLEELSGSMEIWTEEVVARLEGSGAEIERNEGFEWV